LDSLAAVSVGVHPEQLPAEAVDRPLVRASVLVEQAAERAFVDQIDQLRARWPAPGFRLLVTGPWPPYRFAGLPTETQRARAVR
jgi:hypothetical protein